MHSNNISKIVKLMHSTKLVDLMPRPSILDPKDDQCHKNTKQSHIKCEGSDDNSC